MTTIPIQHSTPNRLNRLLPRLLRSGLPLLAVALLFESPAAALNLYVGSNSTNQTVSFTSGTNSYGNTYVGNNNFGNTPNRLNVFSPGTLLTNSGDLIVGYESSENSMVISNGATVANGGSIYGGAFIGLNATTSNNAVLVTGAGSLWTNSGEMTIGYYGSSASMVISNGAVVASGQYINIGWFAVSSNNSVLVTGAGSLWTSSGDIIEGGDLVVGNGGEGTLTVANGGSVVTAAGIIIANQASSVGTLNIGTYGGSNTAGTIISPTIAFGSGSGTINFNQSDTATINSPISGYGTINQLGSGTTILTATNAVSGNLLMNSGTLLVNGVLFGEGTATVSAGATLGGNGIFERDLTVASGGTLASSLKIFGQITLPNQSAIASVTSGTTTAPTGEQLLISSATGGTINTAVGTASVGTLDGASLVLGSWGATVTNLISGSVTTSGGGLTALQGNFTGSISGSGGLVKDGAGTLTFLNSNSYTGPTFINSGVLQVGSGSGVSSGPLGSGEVFNNASLVFNSSNNFLLANEITGSGSLSQIGTGTVTISGSNNYEGTTLVDGGTLIVEGSINSTNDTLVGYNASNSLLVISNGGVVSAGENNYGAVIGLNATSSKSSVLVTGTNSLWTNSGDLTVGYDGSSNSLVISNRGVVVNGQNNNGGVIGLNAHSSNNSVLVTGEGSLWTNSGDLTVGYDGSSNSLVISNGAVVVNNQNNNGGVIGQNTDSSNNSVLVTGEGSLWTNSGDLTVGYDGSSNSLVISNGAVVVNNQNNNGGVIGQNTDSSNNSVLVTGAGSRWSIVGESLTVGNGGEGTLTVASGGSVVVYGIVIASKSGSVGTLNFGTLGRSDTNVALLTESISFGSGTGILNFNQSDTDTINSPISGYGTINQLGSGKTILAASNSFSGPVYVNAGTMLVASTGALSGSGTVTIVSGGKLLNNGSITGTTLMSGTLGGNGGRFNNIQLNGGSSLIWDINSFTGTAETNWDVLNALSLNLSNLSSTNPLTIYVEGISGVGSNTTTYSFNFLNVTNGVTGFNPSDFTINTSLFTVDPSLVGGAWSVGTNSIGGGEVLTLTYAVPEPSTYALLGFGSLVLFGVFRGRRLKLLLLGVAMSLCLLNGAFAQVGDGLDSNNPLPFEKITDTQNTCLKINAGSTNPVHQKKLIQRIEFAEIGGEPDQFQKARFESQPDKINAKVQGIINSNKKIKFLSVNVKALKNIPYDFKAGGYHIDLKDFSVRPDNSQLILPSDGPSAWFPDGLVDGNYGWNGIDWHCFRATSTIKPFFFPVDPEVAQKASVDDGLEDGKLQVVGDVTGSYRDIYSFKPVLFRIVDKKGKVVASFDKLEIDKITPP